MPGTDDASTPETRHPTPSLVGRESELAQLHEWFQKSLHGERQIVFIAGEPGIGKTALVDHFVEGLRNRTVKSEAQPVWIGRSQCIEQYGAGEAYMPLLEAFGRLCREDGGQPMLTVLHQHAPTWLAQMPTLARPEELPALQRKAEGATKERMLRELDDAIEALTAQQPLVLWLEDLHWGDASTVQLVALLARRQERARLLLLATYRPVDVIVREHPLREIKQELQLHQRCEELSLRLLTETAVAQYLALRFGEPHAGLPVEPLARVIHERTEGNPLFMVNVVDDLVGREMLVQVDGAWHLQAAIEEVENLVPDGLRQMIVQHLEQLDAEEHRVLEAASVAGAEFSVALVASALGAAVDVVEEHCALLARRRHVLHARRTEEWPDGTAATCYAFVHGLYQKIAYERVPAARRADLHRRIGERIEAAYGARAGEIAGQVAAHVDAGRNDSRSVGNPQPRETAPSTTARRRRSGRLS